MTTFQSKLFFIIIAIAMFMDSMDTTILNTAIPSIAQDLHIHPIELKLALISYLMSLAIFIPISGWICDKYGIKKTFLSAIGIFTLASLGCGFCKHINALILLRFIQGIGGALNVPVARMIILKSYPKQDFLSKMNAVVMVSSIASMLGPIVGGIIVEHFTWSWIFWVNVPIGIINFFLIRHFLHEFPKKPNHRLDKLGFVLFGLALSSLMLSLSVLSDIELDIRTSFEILLFSMILFLSYFIHSRKKSHPIIRFELFKQKTFFISILGGLFSRICFGGLPFLLPLFFQIQLHQSPIQSGFSIAFIPLGAFLSRTISIFILNNFGFKKTLICNTFLLTMNLWFFSTMTLSTPVWLSFTSLFITGMCLTIQYATLSTLCFEGVSDDNLSASSSIFSTIQQFGISLGVATGAMFLRYFSVHQILHHQTFIDTFIGLSLLSLILLIIFAQLSSEAGLSMIKKK
ncbi:MAG: hypothetical protein QG556_1031 [Pseudomonadota bacterium]|nr:hypothetical protein [Pseudomonadota bacterium]